ncbi:MAG: hypothetical protein ACE5EI_10490 [Thermodesulfobacteriota bacterium]
MYIETLHDREGEIKACYCADTLPAQEASPLFSMKGAPEGWEQARVNIDTLTAMEIDSACSSTVETDPASGRPVIVRSDRAGYIMENFKVDTTGSLTPCGGVRLPAGMKIRGLTRR